MTLPFPLTDVLVEFSDRKKEVTAPLYHDGFFTLNQNEFSMDVKEVGWFYASGGNFVSVVPYKAVTRHTIELYLNGSVYGAILYQRKIIALHGSSFNYMGAVVMICGDPGAGKSTLTASFCRDGAEFLTDDVTPVLFKERAPYIWALSERIKLWSDALEQLDLDRKDLNPVWPDAEKYYHPMDPGSGDLFKLRIIYILQVTDVRAIKPEELSGSDKFEAIRNEIYRPEYLKGMPENETVYFRNIMDICNNVHVFRICRPEKIHINELTRLFEKHLENFSLK